MTDISDERELLKELNNFIQRTGEMAQWVNVCIRIMIRIIFSEPTYSYVCMSTTSIPKGLGERTMLRSL